MKRFAYFIAALLSLGIVGTALAGPTLIYDSQINPTYKSQFVQSSTGSLRNFFNGLYFQSSTGSLTNAFKNIFIASSTGALKANFGQQFIQSSTGALKANFGLQFVQSSTGSLRTLFNTLYFQSSTGSLRTLFNTLYLQTSTGSLRKDFSNRFVQKQGDTMTGGLLIESGTLHGALPAVQAGLLLEISGTASGRIIRAQDGLASSGTLVVANTVKFEKDLDLLNSNGIQITMQAGPSNESFQMNDSTGNFTPYSETVTAANGTKFQIVAMPWQKSGTQMLEVDSGSLSYFQIAAAGNVALGKGLNYTPKTMLEFAGTASGAEVMATRQLRSSGSLSVNGAVTLKSLTNCTSIASDTNGALSCAAGGTLTQSSADTRYVNAAGDTMTGGLLIVNGGHTSLGSADAGILLEIGGTASGRTIHAQDTLTSSGKLIVNGNASIRGTLSGAALTIMRGNSYTLGTLSIGKTGNAATLDVEGSVSGTTLRMSNINGGNIIYGSLGVGVGPSTKLEVSAASQLVTDRLTAGFKISDSADPTKYTAIGFDGTNNVGFIQPAWDSHAFEPLILNSQGGNVGIGKSVPATKLDVVGTMSGTAVMAEAGTASAPAYSFGGDTNTGWSWIGPDIIGLYTGGTERLRVDASGNVGIGTNNTAPGKFNVAGAMSGYSITVQGNPSNFKGPVTMSGTTSIRSARITRYIAIPLCDGVTACAVGTGSMVQVTSLMDRMALSGSLIGAYIAGATNSTKVQVRNVTQAKDLFTTPLTLHTGSTTGSGVINPTIFNVNDILVPNISAVSTTPPKGLTITLVISP